MADYLDKLKKQMMEIKCKTSDLIEETKKDGTLIYFKNDQCQEDEIIKLEGRVETKVKLKSTKND